MRGSTARSTESGVRAGPWSAKSYLCSLVPRGRDVRRMVILTEGRAGSELLVSLLDSHPDMLCDGEVLARRRRAPDRLIDGRRRLAAWRGQGAYGFKVLATHLFDVQALGGPERWLATRAADGWTIVHLQRRNRLHQAISGYRANLTRFHYQRGQVPGFVPLTLDPEVLLRLLRAFDEADDRAGRLLDRLEVTGLVYEDDLLTPADQDRTVRRLTAQLGLPAATTRSDQVRIHPSRLDDMVANPDDIRSALRNTRWEMFL